MKITKQSYSYTYACLHINTLSHVQIYKSTDILARFPILIPYIANVFSAQPPAPSRNGGAYCLSRSFTSCLSRHSKQRHGMVGAYCRSLSFTSCLSRHSKHGMAGAYCRSRPFTSCLSRHSKHGMAGVLLSVTVLHIVPVTPLQAASRNGGSPTVGHGPSHRACHVTPNTEWRESYCRSRSFTSCLSRHSKLRGRLLPFRRWAGS